MVLPISLVLAPLFFFLANPRIQERRSQTSDCSVFNSNQSCVPGLPNDGNCVHEDTNLSTSSHVCDRRRVFSAMSFAVAVSFVASPSLAVVSIVDKKATRSRGRQQQQQEQAVDYDFSCLSDLAPIPDDSVRIYLCRHGQTENNRMQVVQGSRLDPPINEVGTRQAERLGQALCRASTPPTVILHSPLQRARLTAATAANQFTKTAIASSPPPLKMLDSIRELDFGPVNEGSPISIGKPRLLETYSQWALGNINVRMSDVSDVMPQNDDGGESGTDVLHRVERALDDLLVEAEASPNRCVAAVAHSAFVKTLLAVVSNEQNLSDGYLSFDVRNASVCVLEIKRAGQRTRLGANSVLFGGEYSKADSSFTLSFPETKLVRVGERRHLGSLV